MIRAISVFTLLSLLCVVGAGAQEAQESRVFDSDGVQIHYVDQGSGEPVLLIHGFTADLHVNWEKPGLLSRLCEAGYRVIAYDSRGHGRSEKPDDPSMYGPVEVQDAVRLLDHLGIHSAHVVGYSRGGLMANRLRATHPERVRSVTLGGYANSGGGTSPRGQAPAGIADALEQGNLAPLLRWIKPEITPEQIQALSPPVLERNDVRAIAAAFRADDSFSPLTERQLERNEVPTLVLVGSDDPFRPEARRMQEVMGNLEVLIIPRATHMTAALRPEFFTGLLGFLTKWENQATHDSGH